MMMIMTTKTTTKTTTIIIVIIIIIFRTNILLVFQSYRAYQFPFQCNRFNIQYAFLFQVEGFIVGDATDIPPTLMQEKAETSVVSFADITWSSNGDMEQPHAPTEIAARMLGPDRIREALSNITVTKYYTCKDFNYVSSFRV